MSDNVLLTPDAFWKEMVNVTIIFVAPLTAVLFAVVYFVGGSITAAVWLSLLFASLLLLGVGYTVHDKRELKAQARKGH